jgi:hypothetical protein
LYKYGSFKGEGLAYLKEVLLDSKIYLSSPFKFNDPFECRPRLEIGTSQEDRNTAMQEVLSILSKRPPNCPSEKTKLDASITLSMLDDFYHSRGNQYESLLGDFGVYCLSAKRDNLLMWAHYGQAHTGYCLEFDASDGTFFGKAHKVHYQEEYPVIRIIPLDPNRGKKGLLTKSSDWAYEEEWRLINAKECGHINFPPHELIGIILGCKTTDEVAGRIGEMVSRHQYPIRVSRAAINSNCYKLDIIEL